MRFAYSKLRTNARKKGREFAITFEYFLLFAVGSCVGLGDNRKPNGAQVDRIFDVFGYVPGNIQILTAEANIKKSWTQDSVRYRHGYSWMKNYQDETQNIDEKIPQVDEPF